MACPGMAPGAPFVSSALAYLDCQALSIGSTGYAALAAAGGVGAALLTGVLVLFVALFGFRMLTGQTPTVRDGVLAAAKVGVVLALATSWPAYRTLVYDVTLRAPSEIGATIGSRAGLPGAGGGLGAWLQSADDGLLLLNFLGTEPTQLRTDVPEGQRQQQQQQIEQPTSATGIPLRRPDASFDRLMLGLARIVFLVGALAALAVVRLVAGLLLALGPVFAVFLLFDGTRGLFEGWVRGLAGAALGALATSLVLGVELAFVEPWLVGLIALRQADQSIAGVPVELFAVALVFALAIVGVLVAAGRVAFSFRLPTALSNWTNRLAPAGIPAETLRLPDARAGRDSTPATAADERARALVVADAVAASQRREAASPTPASGLLQRSAPVARGGSDAGVSVAPTPVGQSNRRRTRGRMSAGAARRDRTR